MLVGYIGVVSCKKRERALCQRVEFAINKGVNSIDNCRASICLVVLTPRQHLEVEEWREFLGSPDNTSTVVR